MHTQKTDMHTQRWCVCVSGCASMCLLLFMCMSVNVHVYDRHDHSQTRTCTFTDTHMHSQRHTQKRRCTKVCSSSRGELCGREAGLMGNDRWKFIFLHFTLSYAHLLPGRTCSAHRWKADLFLLNRNVTYFWVLSCRTTVSLYLVSPVGAQSRPHRHTLQHAHKYICTHPHKPEVFLKVGCTVTASLHHVHVTIIIVPLFSMTNEQMLELPIRKGSQSWIL